MFDKTNFDESKVEKMRFYSEYSRNGIIVSTQATDDGFNVIINALGAPQKVGHSAVGRIGLDTTYRTLKHGQSDFLGFYVHGKDNVKFMIDSLNSQLAELRQRIALQEKNDEQH